MCYSGYKNGEGELAGEKNGVNQLIKRTGDNKG